MILTFIVLFVASFLFNLLVIVFGKNRVDAFKSQLTFGKYVSELNTIVVETIGDASARVLKICVILVLAILAVFNVLAILGGLAGLTLGTLVAKRVFRIGAVNGFVNKIATYINRSV